MELQQPRQVLVAYARGEAFAENTIAILTRLGYPILEPEAFDAYCHSLPRDGASTLHRPALYIVDDMRLGEVPDPPGGPSIPVITLTGPYGTLSEDSRIVGAIEKPAEVNELYAIFQNLFEETPRSVPRVSTRLSAVCRTSGHEWSASVTSLSRNGCLLRTPEPVPLGGHLELAFELPESGPIRVEAETAYQRVPDLGLVFSRVAPPIQDAITGFVNAALLADPATRAVSR